MMTTLRIDEFVYPNQTRRNITSLTIIKVSKDNIFRYDIYTKQGITDDLTWSSNCV